MPVFTKNALEVDIYLHLCAVKEHTSCHGPFIRFSRSRASPVAGRCIITAELASFWPSGALGNSFEGQDETDEERKRY